MKEIKQNLYIDMHKFAENPRTKLDRNKDIKTPFIHPLTLAKNFNGCCKLKQRKISVNLEIINHMNRIYNANVLVEFFAETIQHEILHILLNDCGVEDINKQEYIIRKHFEPIKLQMCYINYKLDKYYKGE